MNILVMIMGADMQPAKRNTETMIETFINSAKKMSDNKELKNNYHFLIYSGNNNKDISETIDNYTILKLSIDDSITKTYEKTIKAFNYVLDNKKYNFDWIIRINISTFLNIKLLDKVVEQFDKNIIYANAINSIITANEYVNDIYARGDLYIIHIDMLKNILKYSGEFLNVTENMLDHVDDVLFGCAVIKALGPKYHKCYKLIKYNYLPNVVKETDKIGWKELDNNSLSVRVKTVPPEESYSGYSWNDNKWREKGDVIKLKQCNEYYNNISYSDSFKLSNILIDDELGRPTLFAQISTQPLNILHDYLDKKRK